MEELLAPPLARWLAATHGAPTSAQVALAPRILAGEHVLLSSPTGSGKTLAAFLPILSELSRAAPLEERTHCLYVSPLRALVNDMAKSLAAPIEGAALPVSVAVRTGDTTPAERARQARRPPHLLVTTPESLALLLASPKAREHLRGVRWVVVDEVHALAETKRGAQLALTLERLAAYAGEFQRIGLSATVAPIETVGAFLAGDRPVATVEAAPKAPPELDVELVVPDPLALTTKELQEATLARIEREMARSRTLLVFTNTRASAETLAARLRARHPDGEVDDVVMPHHGSMSKAARLLVEDRLKRAQVRCVVASSSLELGIHAEQVDRVLLLGSPKSAARTLQRIGRSGHLPGSTARATILVSDPADLPEALALRGLARERRVEEVRIPPAPLDVLAQHLVAMRLEGHRADEAEAVTRRAYSFRPLERKRVREVWDDLPHVPRHEYLQNASTIPEHGLLKVFHGETFVGEVEEEFAASLQEGEVFVLAGASWRFVRATPAKVHVERARGKDAAIPAWRGEGLSATPLLVRETQKTFQLLFHGRHASGETESRAKEFVDLQRAFAGELEAETFPTEHGRALVVHARLGRRANEALARVLAWRVSAERNVATDAGFAVLGPRAWRPTRAAILKHLRAPLEDDLVAALRESDLLKRRFRHVATRALVLRRAPMESLGQRQLRANMLMPRLPDGHFLLREAMHECLRDALDVDAAEDWCAQLATGARPFRLGALRCASPLAARILAPAGERRHEWLRDAHDAIRYHRDSSMISR